MKLTDLEPRFMRVAEPGKRYVPTASLADAHGLWFDCPCGGGDQIHVWFADRGVPDEEIPSPRWRVSGTSLADLTIAPSINVVGHWHGWVRSGEVTNA